MSVHFRERKENGDQRLISRCKRRKRGPIEEGKKGEGRESSSFS